MRRLPVDDISILMGNLNNLLGTLDELGVPTAPILDRIRLSAEELSIAHATASCSSLSKAIDIYHRYAPISGVYIFGDMQEVGDEVKFTFDASVLNEWPDMLRYEVELEFTLWAKLKANWKNPIDWFDEIQFSFARPSYGQLYQDYFRCPVSFNQAVNQITFGREHLETPFELADEELFRLSAEQCERSLQELPSLTGYTDAASFSRAFSDSMGKSPGSYRNRAYRNN